MPPKGAKSKVARSQLGPNGELKIPAASKEAIANAKKLLEDAAQEKRMRSQMRPHSTFSVVFLYV